MASVTKESNSDVFVNLSDHLGGLVLKEEQKLAVEALLLGKDVMARHVKINKVQNLNKVQEFQ